MSSITDDIFSRSRRRCVVKGRSSYLESESLVPTTEEIKLDDEHSNSDIPNDYEYSDTVDTEDIDEEPVTIDLSDFLNENALLSEPTAEHATESGLALSDCHSQFRVTSSLADPSPIAVEEVPSLKELTLDESITTTEDSPNFIQSSADPSVSVNSSDVFTGSSNISTDVGEENIPIEESVVINKSSPLKGPISKTPMGLSNAFQKFKGVPVMKDLNKNTVQTFGKYPIVKCEKLNMENFVKKNIIKVGNWPLSKVNNHSKSKINVVKNSPLKKFKSIHSRTPKLLNKPISFNKYVSKNASGSSVNIVRSILVDPFDSKPTTVCTIADNSASFMHTTFANSHSSVSESLSKHISIGSEKLIKLVSQKMTPQQNSLIAPNRRFPIITSVNKMDGNSKTFKIISPKKFIPVNENKSMGVTPILPKPVETAVSPVLLKDTAYTVIEPYVEDPTSPVKLKPILTVPIDIIPTVEGIERKERINTTNEINKNVKIPSKFSKLNRSVFLNGAIKQTSVPIKQRNELSPKNKVVLNQNLEKSENVLRNSKEINFEGQTPIVKAKTAIVAAMKSAFSKTPTKRQPKSKLTNHKDNQIQASRSVDGSLFGCQSYNNSLNDILFGFGGSEDFTEESYSVNNSVEVSGQLRSSNISNSNLDSVDSQPVCSDKVLNQNENKCEDKSEDEKHKRVSFFTTYKRQKDSESSHDSDTLSASEGGDDYDEPLPKVAPTTKKKCRKLTSSILRNLKRTQKPMMKYSKIQKQSDVDTSCRTLNHPPGRRISIKEENSNPIPTLPDSISELNSKKDKIMSLSSKSDDNDKETSDTLSIKQKTVSKIDESHSGMSLRNNGKETRTTLRCKRKIRTDQEISSSNVKKLPDKHTSKLNQQRLVSGKDKHLRYIRSRFKPVVKTTQNAKIVTKGRKRLSRPSDIIQEIKTITSGNTMSGKGKKNSKVFSAKENVLNSSENGIDNHDNDLVSKAIAKPSKRKVRSVRPRSKKKLKTLKVLFKRSKQKQNSNPLKMQFDEISLALLDKVSETNSVLENNGSLNSTFRDGKDDKTGSPGKEGNLSDSEVTSNEKSENPMKTTVPCDETQIISNETSDEICPNNSEISKNVENFKSSDDTIIDKCEVIHNTESAVSKVDEFVKVDVAEPLNTPNSVEDKSGLSTLSSDIHTDFDSKGNAGNKMVNAEGDDSSLGSSEIKTLPEQSAEIGNPAESKVTHKRKSCPKLKISKAKTKEAVEPTDMKNWYVSERKASTDSTQSEENVAKQNESVKLNALGSPSDLYEISPVVETKKATDTEHEQSSDLFEIPRVSKSTKTNNIESCEKPEISSTIAESKKQPENNSFTKTINYPVTTDSSASDLNSNVVISMELPIDETSNTAALKTSSDMSITDSTLTGKSADNVTINDEIIDNTVNTEEILKNTDVSVSDDNASLVSSSLVSSTSNPSTVEEQSTGNDVENEPGVCSEQLSCPPIAIKKEPADFENSPVQYSDSTAVFIKVENAVSTYHETPDTVPSLTSTRKGRRSRAFSKKNEKSDVSNTESSRNVGEAVNAHESKAEKKGNSKIEKYFKKQSVTPEASQSTPISDKSVSISPTKGRKKKFCSDSVILPFSMGWMRELVHRSTEGKVGKRQSDIYYFSPEGTKLRSMIEIGNYLTRRNESKLSLVNFTFAKECIFREPFEIERSAKQKSVFSTPAATIKKETSTQSAKKRTLSCSSLKKTPISKTINKRTSLPSKTSTPKLTIRNVNQGNRVKKKFMCSLDKSNSITEKGKNGDGIGTRPRRNTRNVSFGDDSLTAKEIEMSTEQHLISSVTKDDINSETNPENSESTHSDTVQPSSVSKQNVTENKKTKILSTTQNRAKLKSVLPKNVESSLYLPCTPHCPVAKFQIPSIQCSMCLCLFHQNCVPRVAKGLGFACKSCVSAKLELYEILRNPRSLTSAPESAEENNPDMPADMDMSFLSPEINLKMQQSQSLCDGSLTTGTSYGGITSQASYVTEYPDSSSRPVSIHPNSVPYAPQLLSHLLQPQHSLNPNVRMRQVPANSVNLTRSQLVINRTSRNYLPRNFIRVGVRLPAVGNSISLPDSVVIQHLPEGRVVIRKGTLVTAPVSTGPISALENLSQAISPHENWSSISDRTSKNFSTNKNANSIHGKRVNMSGDSVVDKLESVPKIIRLSDPSTSNDKGNALLECNADKSNCDSDCVQSDLVSWNMNRFLTSFECLNLIFKKLNTCDLLRAGQVCKSWKHLALQSILWEKMHFLNLTVTNWKKCCCFMKKIGTKYMDFCGVIHPDPEVPFKELETYIVLLSGVQEVIFDQIPSSLLKAITCNMPQLRRLECHFVTNALTEPEIWSDSCEIELSSLRCLGRLVKLKIGSGGGIILNRGPEYLMPYLPNLRHVSLTGFKFCSHINLESLSQQKELISLELGDCVGVEPGIYALLGCLSNLKSLRLENGGSMDDIKLSEALRQMKGLEVLELMNFKIPTNLVNVFKNFDQLIHLNVWPDITTEGPLINRNLLQAMSNSHDLSYVCWGVIADGESVPDTLEIRSSTDEDNTEELTFEELFNKLVGIFPECRVEVKCVPRDSWREFCSTRR